MLEDRRKSLAVLPENVTHIKTSGDGPTKFLMRERRKSLKLSATHSPILPRPGDRRQTVAFADRSSSSPFLSRSHLQPTSSPRLSSHDPSLKPPGSPRVTSPLARINEEKKLNRRSVEPMSSWKPGYDSPRNRSPLVMRIQKQAQSPKLTAVTVPVVSASENLPDNSTKIHSFISPQLTTFQQNKDNEFNDDSSSDDSSTPSVVVAAISGTVSSEDEMRTSKKPNVSDVVAIEAEDEPRLPDRLSKQILLESLKKAVSLGSTKPSLVKMSQRDSIASTDTLRDTETSSVSSTITFTMPELDDEGNVAATRF